MRLRRWEKMFSNAKKVCHFDYWSCSRIRLVVLVSLKFIITWKRKKAQPDINFVFNFSKLLCFKTVICLHWNSDGNEEESKSWPRESYVFIIFFPSFNIWLLMLWVMTSLLWLLWIYELWSRMTWTYNDFVEHVC